MIKELYYFDPSKILGQYPSFLGYLYIYIYNKL